MAGNAKEPAVACENVLAYFWAEYSVHDHTRPRVKILFTSTLTTSFVRSDLDLLSRHFAVNHLLTVGWRAPSAIWKHLRSADLTFTWFASVYSAVVVFLAKRVGKNSIIVVGGVDAARYPEINYGIWLNPWKSILVKYAMRNAYRLLVVDPHLKREVTRLAKYSGANVEYVPTGYDPHVWAPSGQKESFVLTVAACHDEDRLKKKGIDVLLQTATMMQETRFVVIGIAQRLIMKFRESVPANVELIPFTDQREILRYYQRAKVYCQPSYTEGLPNSLCEAMLCECVPVGTNVGGIPTAIENVGYLVEYGDVGGLAQALKSALVAAPEMGTKARERIAATFTLERREQSLIRLIQEAVK